MAKRCAVGLLFFCIAARDLFAGGSGLNVIVVANQNSSNSLQLANYYCEQRHVPPQNVLRINWTGGSVDWTKADFDTFLRVPLEAMIASRQLSNQVEYVFLSMDIPYRVTLTTGSSATSGINSTTTTLFYGFKVDGCISCPAGVPGCNLPAASTSAYAASEGIFRQTPPISASSNSWLTMMCTSSNLAQAKAVIDRGVISDYSFPTQSVYLIHFEGDPIRGLRYLNYEDAMFECAVQGLEQITRSNTYAPVNVGFDLGSQFGAQTPGLGPNLFAPGALADNLTSFSGYLLENSGHTDALDYLNAGATASYGTVTEPCAYPHKFASPRNYFYQSRGFSAAECYYQSVTNPYQGILVGEPLAAPFAQPSTGNWLSLPEGSVLVGTTNLSFQFTAADNNRPIQQVDLFVDGLYSQTITNISPRQNNQLFVTLNGNSTSYTVPNNATLKSIATGLTSTLNTFSYSNATKVVALAHGDRVELRSVNLALRGSQVSVSVSNSIGAASLLTTQIHLGRTNFVDSPGTGLRSYVLTNLAGATLPVGAFIQVAITKTNGTVITVSATNTDAGAGLNTLAHQIVDAVNTNAALQLPDGVVIEDAWMHEDEPWRTFVFGPDDHSAEFNIRARSPGWQEAQIQVSVTASLTIVILPIGTNRLDENISDLYPRDHLYITAGFTNLPLTFGFNTTTQADGFHELTAVAYEGSHVRTQKRITQIVRFQNSPLSAVFSCLLCDTNTALEATLQFSVAANTNTISRIELFSTGGSWGVVSNLQTANFSLAATNLGLGLHPFYAVVTRNDGKQYRTETKWIRLTSEDAPFAVSISGTQPVLSWPATAGRRYEILSTTNITDPLSLRDAVIPTNSPGLWGETNNLAPSRFYRVRTAP